LTGAKNAKIKEKAEPMTTTEVDNEKNKREKEKRKKIRQKSGMLII